VAQRDTENTLSQKLCVNPGKAKLITEVSPPGLAPQPLNRNIHLLDGKRGQAQKIIAELGRSRQQKTLEEGFANNTPQPMRTNTEHKEGRGLRLSTEKHKKEKNSYPKGIALKLYLADIPCTCQLGIWGKKFDWEF